MAWGVRGVSWFLSQNFKIIFYIYREDGFLFWWTQSKNIFSKGKGIYVENSGSWEGILAQTPESGGDFENSQGHGELPSKPPERVMGIWGKSTIKNRILYIFFSHSSHTLKQYEQYYHLYCVPLKKVLLQHKSLFKKKHWILWKRGISKIPRFQNFQGIFTHKSPRNGSFCPIKKYLSKFKYLGNLSKSSKNFGMDSWEIIHLITG